MFVNCCLAELCDFFSKIFLQSILCEFKGLIQGCFSVANYDTFLPSMIRCVIVKGLLIP